MCDVIKEAEEKKMRFEHYHERYLQHCHNVQVSTDIELTLLSMAPSSVLFVAPVLMLLW